MIEVPAGCSLLLGGCESNGQQQVLAEEHSVQAEHKSAATTPPPNQSLNLQVLAFVEAALNFARNSSRGGASFVRSFARQFAARLSSFDLRRSGDKRVYGF